MMVILLFLQCVFMGITSLPRIRGCMGCYATWVLTVPFALWLSLVLDISARGKAALNDPFFVPCGYYALGLSLFAIGGFLFRRYQGHRSSGSLNEIYSDSTKGD